MSGGNWWYTFFPHKMWRFARKKYLLCIIILLVVVIYLTTKVPNDVSITKQNTGKGEKDAKSLRQPRSVGSSNYASDTVWPLPKHKTLSGSPYPISRALSINTLSKSNILERGITRYLKYITTRLVAGDEKESRHEQDAELKLVIVNVAKDDETLGMETLYNYTIWFRRSDTLYIDAQSPFGALYGLETFSQLIQNGALVNRFVNIKDEPSFVHRGLLLDTGRRFFPIELLYNTLEAMSFVKLNVFHFHLSDVCRFSVESKWYPDLRNNESQIYSQDDIKNLIAYARDRGIRVMPEVESASHGNGLMGLYNNEKTGLKFCNNSIGYMELYNDPKLITLRNMKSILSEMMSLFPDQLFHLGLDEIFLHKTCTMKNMKSLQTALLSHVATKKTTVAWEEAFTWTETVLKNTIVQAWKSASIKAIVGKKHYAISSLYTKFYLDLDVTPATLWTDIATGLDQNEVKYLLGGEMAMWSDEYCYRAQCYNVIAKKPKAWWMYYPAQDGQFTQSVSGIIWPRAVVGAGSFWNYDSNLKVPQSADFKSRYNAMNRMLQQRGILSCPTGCKCDYLTRCGRSYSQFHSERQHPIFMK